MAWPLRPMARRSSSRNGGRERCIAYASTKTFSHPLHGQPVCDGAKNQGFTTLARWHVPDPIPFKKSLTFDLGIWHHGNVDDGDVRISQ